jgi:hypothetical protein
VTPLSGGAVSVQKGNGRDATVSTWCPPMAPVREAFRSLASGRVVKIAGKLADPIRFERTTSAFGGHFLRLALICTQLSRRQNPFLINSFLLLTFAFGC